jgi:NADPH:quinone reductase-like Zn-dependent oxidoreductase
VKHGQALHHFFHDIFGTVNELFHDKATVQRRVAGLFPKCGRESYRGSTPAVLAGNLLIVGGAGGVGSILIQIACKLIGLTVIAMASRPETKQ